MHKIGGHVFQPVIGWIEGQGVKLDKNWTVKSQCELPLSEEVGASRVAKGAVKRRGFGGMKLKEMNLDVDHIEKVRAAERREREGCLTVKEVRRRKRMTKGLVVAPIDKCATEAVFI